MANQPTPGIGMETSVPITDRSDGVWNSTFGVEDGLLRQSWAAETTYESLLNDPMLAVRSLTKTIDPARSKTMAENALVTDVTPSGDEKYARSVNLQMTKALNGAAYEGRDTDNVMGNEENVRLRYFKAHAQDWGKGVTGQQFGIDFRELKPTQIFEITKPLLAQWQGEYYGYAMRHAYCYGISSNLIKAPVSLTLKVNPNAYIPGIGILDYTSYADQAAFETDLNTQLNGATIADAHLSVRVLLDMVDDLAESYITPVMWGGKELYVLYAHPSEFTSMLDPKISGSFNKYWVDAASLTSNGARLSDVIPGSEFIIGDSIVVCRDRRAPTYKFDDLSLSTQGVFQFLKMGRVDDRKDLTGGTDLWNANILVGAKSLVKFEPEKPHFELEKDVYGKYKNIAYFGACSYQTPAWDVNPTDATVSTLQQESSAIVYTARTSFPTS